MAVAELAGIHTTQTQVTKVTATAKATVEVHTGHTTTQHRAEAAPAVTAAGASPGHKPKNVASRVQRPLKGSGRSLQRFNAFKICSSRRQQ